eukprot:CAMPEP_0201508454 /NCGR_PEP_ID=MMETSP0161_2-20130828/1824_1 /ASSEMBLY_ACC=CAM_ASM_000251 /TAXON_ID=180227 /ORGANISM="Neoparamoeba aestuarina, Strain SoJaBio B1-5/56/2" /LENGTH=158 /DNA_ID=CAMNT_0047903129 /DNA_START=72 /DNA_END=548 /DNA_ORIENTATION=+
MGEGRELPLFFCGKVETGFGRGGKSLNCPTANLSPGSCRLPLSETENGVYFGWAQVNRSLSGSLQKGEVLPMVMSIGWNPHFNDLTQKTAEAHILANFEEDFYGEEMRVIASGYIRGQEKYNSLEELKAAIANDIKVAKESLETEEHRSFKDSPHFLS